MNELALFAGAGGGILGGQLLGWRTVCAVELDPYAAGVLLARQNDGALPPFPVWDDVRTFDGRPWRGVVDVVSGGFPCQDISVAGKGAGIEGGRSGLWREMARIIGEVRPRFAFVENSPVLVRRGLARVLGDLAALGFDAEWCVVGASDVGAPHIRKRIWILAHDVDHADGGRREERDPHERRVPEPDPRGDDVAHAAQQHGPGQEQTSFESGRGGSIVADSARGETHVGGLGRVDETPRGGEGRDAAACAGRADVPDADSLRQPQPQGSLSNLRGRIGDVCADVPDTDGLRAQIPEAWGQPAIEVPRRDGGHGDVVYVGACEPGWWAAEPGVGRVAHGVAHRVDRLKCLGNGQVPLAAATAFRLLLGRMTEF